MDQKQEQELPMHWVVLKKMTFSVHDFVHPPPPPHIFLTFWSSDFLKLHILYQEVFMNKTFATVQQNF